MSQTPPLLRLVRMQARMKSPVLVLPAALEAIRSLSKVIDSADVPPATLELVRLRASQINGCAVCLDMHWRALKKLGESDERIATVAAWREAPYYSESERVALALAEAATRVADRSDPVPDDIWNEATRHYNETQLAALLLSIGVINLFNRINAATRQPTGPWVAQYV
jgi:AhpD family alkylhydroperoxidase